MLLRSERLTREGVLHAFSCRDGGVSQGPFASLNLGGSVGDDPMRVEANHARFAEALGVPRASLRSLTQVHGARVVELRDAAPLSPDAQGDGLVSRTPGLTLGIRTADCVPLLLFDKRSGAVGAVHAGWRGTHAAIAARAVEALRRHAPEGELVIALGPCIRRCCYEVDEPLAGRFERLLGVGVVERVGRSVRLDLVEANLRVLERAGVPRDKVEVIDGCTACAPHRFFSHRRDEGRTGRHLSVIAARPVS